MNAKISVLIPVYNTEQYLRQCLDSVLFQTLSDIEIICVNDGSTDSSLVILDEYQNKYPQLTVVNSSINEGLARARYHGILAARAPFIMFLDSDDYLEPQACEIAYKTIVKNDCDIVNFGANVIAANYVEKTKLQLSKKYFSAKKFSLKGTEILGDCYQHRRYNWNVWTKIYRAELLKEVVESIPAEKCVMGEDMMLFFFIAFHAQKLISISDNLINYRLGNGVSTQELTYESYVAHLRQAVAIQGIKRFIDQNKLSEHQWIKNIYKNLKEGIEIDLVAKYVFSLAQKDGGRAFDEYLKYFDIMTFIEGLTKIDVYNRAQLIAKISASQFVKSRSRRKFKTIGIFYYRYFNGGIERVISKLMPVFLRLGYRVVFFEEHQADKKDFPLPSPVTKVVLPKSDYVSKEEYLIHAQEFKLMLIRNKIDVMLYQASTALYLLEELLICKSLGIPFIITTHDYYSAAILAQDSYMLQKRALYSMCDAVQTITRDEEYAWKQMGVKAYYLPNPLTFKPVKTARSTLENFDIGWIGRIDFRQKCPEFAVEAMKYVKRAIPEAKLHIIGEGELPSDDRYLRKVIKKAGVSSNVAVHGFVKNPEKYYQSFSCFLMTSAYEVSPMVLGEAMSYGLPIVLFDLPYVELLKNSAGCLRSPQMNVAMLAQNIIKVLSDRQLRNEMSQASLNRIVEVSKFDIGGAWSQFFAAVESNALTCIEDSPLATIVDITYQHWVRSLDRISTAPDHPDNYINMKDGRYQIIDTEYIDRDLLYGLLLKNRSPVYKALYFFFGNPKLFWTKLGKKLFSPAVKRSARRKNPRKSIKKNSDLETEDSNCSR